MPAEIIKIKSHEKYQEYQWNDCLGFHQYYCETDMQTDMQTDIQTDTQLIHSTIHNFKCIDNQNGKTYSWNDCLGFHQYHCFLN